MECCHGNGLKPKIDNQNISLILTISILGNLYGETFREINYVSFSNSPSIGRVFVNTLGSHLKQYLIDVVLIGL